MNKDELRKLLALRDVKGLGSTRIIDLLTRFLSVNEIFEAEYPRFADFGFVNEDIFERIQKAAESTEKYDNILTECAAADISLISILDSDFPSTLREERIAALLFTKGDQKLLKKPCISIVGSQESSQDSNDWAFNVAKMLSERGYVIVSGGAKGIDTSAHKGALAGSGETICVLGSGIENVYPPENEELVDEITQTGLVISHRPPNENVNRYSLLDRNKITSGLSPGLVIVSSSGQGGTASQYQDGLNQDKRILCPNPALGLEPSEGIRDILGEGHAHTVTDADDIIERLESRQRQASLDEL